MSWRQHPAPGPMAVSGELLYHLPVLCYPVKQSICTPNQETETAGAFTQGKHMMTEITTGDHGERLSRVEGAVEQINGTLQQLSARLDSMERQTNVRFDSLEERINWVTGLQFVTVFALGALILLKL